MLRLPCANEGRSLEETTEQSQQRPQMVFMALGSEEEFRLRNEDGTHCRQEKSYEMQVVDGLSQKDEPQKCRSDDVHTSN